MTEALIVQEQNIIVGAANIVGHKDGGWALPGGTVTQDRQEALQRATEFSQYIEAHGGRERAVRTPQRVRRTS